ncbi:hypothetical protein KAR48_08995 [bacterium]|nr:hypothetical protein [bacterium]
MEINARSSTESTTFLPPLKQDSAKVQAEHSDTTPVDKNSTDQLSDSEQRDVQKMKQREIEVRAHEQAHRIAGGRYVRGGVSYEYNVGPDGKRYITGGEVSIDTAAVPGDPKATVEKMRTVKRAALAPAKPSQQDRSVASKAQQVEAQAQQEIIKENMTASKINSTEENETDSKTTGSTGVSEQSSNAGTAMAQSNSAAMQPELPFPEADIHNANQYSQNIQHSNNNSQHNGDLLNIVI